MSPLWRDRLHIALCPDKVVIVRLGKGLRPAVVGKHQLHCDPAPGMPAWFAAVNALMQWLTEAKPKKADVVVVLSNHLVRYGVLPWTEAIDNAEEDLAFARIHFEKVYGDVAGQWALRISDAPYECPRIASAVDQELLDGLNDILSKASLRLASVQPYLMAAFNASGKRLEGQSGLFVLIEPGKACLTRIADGKCLDVKSALLQSEVSQDLTELLNREMLMAELDANAKIFLHAAEFPKLDLAGKVSATIQGLPPHGKPAARAEGQFGMALSGAA